MVLIKPLGEDSKLNTDFSHHHRFLAPSVTVPWIEIADIEAGTEADQAVAAELRRLAADLRRIVTELTPEKDESKRNLVVLRVEVGAPVALCDVPSGRGAGWGENGGIVLALNSPAGLWRVPLPEAHDSSLRS